MSLQNLTPEQRKFSREVRREAFRRIPETCDTVRQILDDAKQQILRDMGWDPADEALIDAAVTWAFSEIRNKVSHPFRTEQMRLLDELLPAEDDLR